MEGNSYSECESLFRGDKIFNQHSSLFDSFYTEIFLFTIFSTIESFRLTLKRLQSLNSGENIHKFSDSLEISGNNARLKFLQKEGR